MKRHLTILSAILLSACCVTSAFAFSPIESEQRVVSQTADPARTLTVNEPMVVLDAPPPLPATRGIRFPAGTYVLEAEDGDDLYYRAPDKIEYRIFTNGVASDGRFIAGGIYVSKHSVDLVPAGAYMSVDETHKVLTWKLGSDFLSLEGSKWKRTP
jgi:hypothetical protein